MPELPDLTVYLERLQVLLMGIRLDGCRLRSPFLVRTAVPPLAALSGRTVSGLRRLGKRIILQLEPDYFLAIHLMIAGRLHWKPLGSDSKSAQCAFDFQNGTLLLTEASSKKRASVHVVQGESQLALLDAGGEDPIGSSAARFKAALLRENRTLKRALTDPRIFSGIGNAYSDEILFRARLSPVKLTRQLDERAIQALRRACRTTLLEWTERLRAETGTGFPEKVTAFRAQMAVHGRYGQPCPRCETLVQRIRHRENEVNYCPRCQTEGRLLADRGLSRLLKSDWPKSIDELEERRGLWSGGGQSR